VLALALACSAVGQAHEFWIEPSSFHPRVDESVALTLRVGRNLVGDSLPYIPSWFLEYYVRGPDTRRPVEANLGDDPAGTLRPEKAGLYVVAYRSAQDFAEMDAETFRHYLEREGLQAVARSLGAAPDGDDVYHELYYRYAKAFLRAGKSAAAGAAFDDVLGFEIELIPERDPTTLRAGESLGLRLLYHGAPLEGALVNAYGEANPNRPVQGRTDAMGRVTLALPDGGMWLLNATHLRPSRDNTRASWASVWASVTFHISKHR
jgi:hypothetical protein